MARLARDWRALTPEQRLAGVAAVALFVTMLLPWYQQNAVVSAPRTTPLQSRNLNAFQAFSFIEAAVLLVAVAVVYLLYARAEGKRFHLPGSDGAVVMAAGMWTALLLVIRLFDKPGITTHGVAANVGVQWGIFFALGAAGLLTYAGSRMRAARRPEPPLRRNPPAPHRDLLQPRSPADPFSEPQSPADPSSEPQSPAHPFSEPRSPADPFSEPQSPRGHPSPRPATPSAPTSQALPPGRPRRPPAPPASPTVQVRAGRSRIGRRPVPASPATEQLSFEDQPPNSG